MINKNESLSSCSSALSIQPTLATASSSTTASTSLESTSQELSSNSDEPPDTCDATVNIDLDTQIEYISEEATNLITSKNSGLGLYQILSFVLISLTWSIGNGWYAYISVFTGIIPEHKCVVNNLTNVTATSESCLVRDLYTNKSYTQCDSYTYEFKEMKSTIISEYNFVCSKDYYFESAYSLEQIGYICGTLVFSLLADKKGRRYVYLLVLFLMCLFGILQYFVLNFVAYMFIGFVINLLASGLDSVCVPLVLETFNTQNRTHFGIGIEYIWVIVLTSLSLVAYLINTWRELRLFIFFILVLLFITSYFFLHESLTWLLSVKKFKEAKVCVNSILRFNKLSVKNDHKKCLLFNKFDKLNELLPKPEDSDDSNRDEGKKRKIIQKNLIIECYREMVNAFKVIFKYSRYRLYVLIMALNWFATALVYDGLTYLSNHIGDNVYISWTLMNIVELPAQFMCFYLVSRFGRRITTCLALITCGLALITNYLIYSFVPSLDERISLVLYLLAKFSSTQAYSAVILHAPELFPTSLRSFGYGICLFSGKLTSVLSPFISLYLKKILDWLPGVIYGLISIICGFICLYVPETLNRQLPNTIDDVLKWPRTLTKEEWLQVKQQNKLEWPNKMAKSIKKCLCTKRRASVYVYSGKLSSNGISTSSTHSNSNNSNSNDIIILKKYSDALP